MTGDGEENGTEKVEVEVAIEAVKGGEADASECAGLVTAGAEEAVAMNRESVAAHRTAQLPDSRRHNTPRARGFRRHREEPHRAERRVAPGAAEVDRAAVAGGSLAPELQSHLAPGEYSLTADIAAEWPVYR